VIDGHHVSRVGPNEVIALSILGSSSFPLRDGGWLPAGHRRPDHGGPAGMIDSGVAGLIFGATYLLPGRNLWPCVLAHGLHDTIAVVAVYLGWAH